MQTGNFNLQMQEIQHWPGAQVYFEATAQDRLHQSEMLLANQLSSQSVGKLHLQLV